MADPREPADETAKTASIPSPSEPPRPSASEVDAYVRNVSDWVTAFAKAMRGARVYAENNEMHQKFVDRAHDGLTALLAGQGELALGVREDRLLLGSDVVHFNSDRQDGLPFILYRNAFRRIVFTKGMQRDELLALLGALNADYSSFDFAGEDLLAALWRLQLPHLRYVTIDALSLERRRLDTDDLDDTEIDRIQADIEGIVAAIYRNAAPDEDIVRGVSIGREDLEVLKDIRTEAPEDLDLLDQVTERAITDVPVGQLKAIQSFLESDDRDALTRRMLDILVRILFKEDSGAASSSTVELLQQLYDSLLLAQRYSDARGLVERLRSTVESAEDMQEQHIAQHLLRLFATEARVLPVLDAFNDGYRTVPMSELVGFLQALGPNVAPVLLSGLGNLDSAAHRKLICDLIAEFGVPDVSDLEQRSEDAKWFVVRDILELARHHPLERITRLVRDALNHEHPKVRAQAVRILRDYGPGVADDLVGESLRDADSEVRIVAARVAASRRSKSTLSVFESVIKEDNIAERELRELKVLLGAYASVGQGSSVSTLGTILHPSFFTRIKTPELQVAAASALGLVPSDKARNYLRRGARSLSSKVREACKRAMAQTRRTIVDSSEDVSASSMTLEAVTAESSYRAPKVRNTSSGIKGPLPEVQHRSGPAVPVVHSNVGLMEEVPRNLPPAPGASAAPKTPLPRDTSAIEVFNAAYSKARAEESGVQPAAEPDGTPSLGPEVYEYLGLEPPPKASSASVPELDFSSLITSEIPGSPELLGTSDFPGSPKLSLHSPEPIDEEEELVDPQALVVDAPIPDDLGSDVYEYLGVEPPPSASSSVEDIVIMDPVVDWPEGPTMEPPVLVVEEEEEFTPLSGLPASPPALPPSSLRSSALTEDMPPPRSNSEWPGVRSADPMPPLRPDRGVKTSLRSEPPPLRSHRDGPRDRDIVRPEIGLEPSFGGNASPSLRPEARLETPFRSQPLPPPSLRPEARLETPLRSEPLPPPSLRPEARLETPLRSEPLPSSLRSDAPLGTGFRSEPPPSFRSDARRDAPLHSEPPPSLPPAPHRERSLHSEPLPPLRSEGRSEANRRREIHSAGRRDGGLKTPLRSEPASPVPAPPRLKRRPTPLPPSSLGLDKDRTGEGGPGTPLRSEALSPMGGGGPGSQPLDPSAFSGLSPPPVGSAPPLTAEESADLAADLFLDFTVPPDGEQG